MNIYIHIISYYGDTIFIKWYVLHIYFIVLQGSRMVKILKSRTNLAKYCRIWLDGSSGVHPRNCFGIAGRVPHPLYKPCIIQPIIISYTCQTVSRPTKNVASWLHIVEVIWQIPKFAPSLSPGLQLRFVWKVYDCNASLDGCRTECPYGLVQVMFIWYVIGINMYKPWRC